MVMATALLSILLNKTMCLPTAAAMFEIFTFNNLVLLKDLHFVFMADDVPVG